MKNNPTGSKREKHYVNNILLGARWVLAQLGRGLGQGALALFCVLSVTSAPCGCGAGRGACAAAVRRQLVAVKNTWFGASAHTDHEHRVFETE